ncbi:MAG: pilus assembly protein CpaE [Oscillochloris sp.]|nr:pilus assembly protein CpaE [Oscillochloris sp.]
MISFDLAWQLRDAGLQWNPAEHDIFVLPGRELDDQKFVVSGLPSIVQLYNGHPVVTFHASVEWALDYVMLGEVLWLPQEHQLRDLLAAQIDLGATLCLERNALGYRCTVTLGGAQRSFDGSDAETAYGEALLAALVET